MKSPFLATALVTLAIDHSLSAAPGDLDATFGTGGKVSTDILGNDEGRSMVVQSDGKILVAGRSDNGSNQFFTLVRYLSTGALDTGFGSGGKVTTAIGGINDMGFGLAVQSDGKILVAGRSYNGSGNYDFALARYTSTGALDTSFNGNGKVITPIGSDTDQGYSVAVQGDGKILVAGKMFNGSNWRPALVRYTSNGDLDGTFGGGGKVVTPLVSSGDEGFSVAVQNDGKILLAGDSLGDFALLRYTSTGALDEDFDGDGMVITPVGGGLDQAHSIVLQGDGKILVAGYSVNGTEDFSLVRYTSTGALDTSFGSGGKVITSVGNTSDRGHSVAVQGDGKILVAGESLNNDSQPNPDFALVRYTSTGVLDTSFGTGGKVTTRVRSTDSRDVGYGVALQSDGKILVAGSSSHSGTNDFALVRYEGDATPTALQAWRQTYFGTTANSGNAADGFDYDLDGLANLQEWASQLNPTTASTLAQSIVRNGGDVEYTYARSISAFNAGAGFIVEWSDTLAANDWHITGVTQVEVSNNGTTQTMKATLPSGINGRRFVRLRITAP